MVTPKHSSYVRNRQQLAGNFDGRLRRIHFHFERGVMDLLGTAEILDLSAGHCTFLRNTPKMRVSQDAHGLHHSFALSLATDLLFWFLHE